MENSELKIAILGLFKEIVQREKKKAIESDDYAKAFVTAIIEGILRQTELEF